jgi:hypothetical protein
MRTAISAYTDRPSAGRSTSRVARWMMPRSRRARVRSGVVFAETPTAAARTRLVRAQSATQSAWPHQVRPHPAVCLRCRMSCGHTRVSTDDDLVRLSFTASSAEGSSACPRTAQRCYTSHAPRTDHTGSHTFADPIRPCRSDDHPPCTDPRGMSPSPRKCPTPSPPQQATCTDTATTPPATQKPGWLATSAAPQSSCC